MTGRPNAVGVVKLVYGQPNRPTRGRITQLSWCGVLSSNVRKMHGEEQYMLF